MSDDKSMFAQARVWSLVDDLAVKEDVDPLQVAAALMSTAVRIYRTVLSKDDFHTVLDTVAEISRDIEPLDFFNNTPKTLQ